MKNLRHLIIAHTVIALIATVLLACAVPPPAAAFERRKPNVVLFLADDLGYAEVGCFGQKRIRTPNIDRLAAEGMRFTNLYCGNAVCAPLRCVLMTGLHPGHAFIRDNRSVPPEGQYPIPAGTVTLARLLHVPAMPTGGFGKWGLGPPASTGDPLAQGFDRFYGYNCQAVVHNYYPTYLWITTAASSSTIRSLPPIRSCPRAPTRTRRPATGATPRPPWSTRPT